MKAWIETWRTSHRMNEQLMAAIPATQFSDTSSAKGRSVGAQLAHIHNVRLMWLKVAASDLMDGQQKIEKEPGISKAGLMKEMSASADAMATLMERGFRTGRIKGFKPHPEAFLGYLIAHEAHHRGQVILILKENGHLPDKKILYGLWEWGTK